MWITWAKTLTTTLRLQQINIIREQFIREIFLTAVKLLWILESYSEYLIQPSFLILTVKAFALRRLAKSLRGTRLATLESVQAKWFRAYPVSRSRLVSLKPFEVLAIKWGLEYARLERLQRSTTEAMGQKRKADGSHKLSNADRLMRSP